jgi:membrane protease YdiL (CAAX protease family)
MLPALDIMETPTRRPLLALALLVPAPSLGVLAGMVLFPGTALGTALFAASKVWLFAFPLLWLKFAERGPLSLSPVRQGGMRAGALSGAGIGLLIAAVYLACGTRLIHTGVFVDRMRAIGLGTWPVFAGGALYWILVNSVLEEYVWRWFVYTRCETLLRPAAAVVVSALCFTLHHFVAIRVYLPLPATLLCCAGVFAGGVIWSALYLRYRSIWPGYLSHALADLAVFAIGARLLFSHS